MAKKGFVEMTMPGGYKVLVRRGNVDDRKKIGWKVVRNAKR